MECPPKYDEASAPPPGENTAMMGAPPPAVSVNYVQAPATKVITTSCVFSEFPMQTTCPSCHSCITTRTSYTPGALTWIICLVICFFGGFLGCCLIPFCLDFCQDVVHSCPSCHTVLGTFKRM